MLFLLSDGLRTEKLQSSFKTHLPKQSKTAAVITTASKPFPEPDPNIAFHQTLLEKLGLHTQLFDIETQNPNNLHTYDVVVIMGGNPFYLLHALNKTNSKPIIKTLMEQRTLVAISAGSMVLGENIGIAHALTPEINMGLTDFTGMQLTHINLCPHKSTFLSQFKDSAKAISDFENQTGFKITCIDDGEGFIITNGKNLAI